MPVSFPFVSVVVRSCRRPVALAELLDAILRQRYPNFEVVVVEQTPDMSDLDAARLAPYLRDPRVRVLRFPPLGGARARNEGARAARGEILLFMDDDDLPHGEDWIAAHAANYRDPLCLAATGRSLLEDEPEPSRRYLARARAKVLSLVPIVLWQRVYVRSDERRRVQSIHGGNTSVRRSVLARVGLWDECTPVEDELSFCYRLRARMQRGEYLIFDPAARMIRRTRVPGGLEKRFQPIQAYGEKVFTFFHNVVAHYFPIRLVVAYPLFAAWTFVACLEWLWEKDNASVEGTWRKAWTSLWFAAAMPGLWWLWMGRLVAKRIEHGPPTHEPPLYTTATGPVAKVEVA